MIPPQIQAGYMRTKEATLRGAAWESAPQYVEGMANDPVHATKS